MARENPRLQFTDEELTPGLERYARRADKAADKAEAAQSRLAKGKKKAKRRVTVQNDAPCGGDRDAPAHSKRPKSEQPKKKGRDGLRFEDADKTAQSSKLRHEAENVKTGRTAKAGKTGKAVEHPFGAKPHSQTAGALAAVPLKAVSRGVHQKIAKNEEDNIGLESAHSLEQSVELCGRAMMHSARSKKLKLHRRAEKAEKRLEKANVNLLYQKSLWDNPQPSGNPLSRLRQKRRIKKQYAAALRKQQSGGGAASTVCRGVKQAASGTRKAVGFIMRHRKGAVLIGLTFVALVFLLNLLSSCSMLLEGGLSVLGGSTYPSADEDVLGAEAAYAGMETELEEYLNDYEDTHNYDAYIYELDPVGHDPYILTALLSALHPGVWILDEVEDTLETLFNLQYVLSETVTEETRYDADDEPYTYSICTVKLETTDLSHLPVYLLDEEGMTLYATYMAAGGNRPDLFPSSEFPNAVQRGDYLDYDVPPEALEDATFAAMLSEAEKYLGWPYVWGGASPATSFDCSGFVSWVINHSGWNYGRLTAQGLFNVTTPVTAANARPGDLVFFKGTYNTTEVSHVGIYVGNHMMVHAGDPISYANLDENYWQQHIFCYGRLSAT